LSQKRIIDGLDGFRELAGKPLFTSEPFQVTKERIQEFCRSVGNDEWIHWDEDRCRQSHLGGIIMPAFMGPALMSKAYFDHVEFRNVDGLFQGVNRLRLLKPVRAGESVYQVWAVGEVHERDKGIAVIYHVEWFIEGQEEPAIVAEYVLRYW
jgi:acyl dehydratase